MMVGVLAAIAAIAGLALVLLTIAVASPAIAPGTEAQAGTVSVWVDSSEWLAGAHDDHDDAAGGGDGAENAGGPAASEIVDLTRQADSFAMPGSMMPGTPEQGYQRLQIDLSISNRGAAAAEVSPAEFHLENSDGVTWPALFGGTFNRTQLAGSHMMHTILAFDIADEMADDNLELVWTTDDATHRFSITTGDHHG